MQLRPINLICVKLIFGLWLSLQIDRSYSATYPACITLFNRFSGKYTPTNKNNLVPEIQQRLGQPRFSNSNPSAGIVIILLRQSYNETGIGDAERCPCIRAACWYITALTCLHIHSRGDLKRRRWNYWGGSTTSLNTIISISGASPIPHSYPYRNKRPQESILIRYFLSCSTLYTGSITVKLSCNSADQSSGVATHATPSQ